MKMIKKNRMGGVVFFVFFLIAEVFGLSTAFASSTDLPPDLPSPVQGFNSSGNFNKAKHLWVQEAIAEEKKFGGKHKKTTIENLHSIDKSIDSGMWPNLIPVGNFHGAIKKIGTVKIVYGVSSIDPYRVQATFGNIKRVSEYLNKTKTPYKIEVVVYDYAVKYFDSRPGKNLFETGGLPEPLGEQLEKYIQSLKNSKHVKIVLCRMAMTGAGMVRHDIPDWIGITPMASLEIVRLVKNGYVYLTN